LFVNWWTLFREFMKTRHDQIIYLDKNLLTSALFLFLMFFISNDTYLFGTNSNSVMVSLPRYFLLFYCCTDILPVFYTVKNEADRKYWGIYIWMLAVLCVVSVIHSETFKSFALKGLCLTTGCFFATRKPMKEFVGAYIGVMTILAVFSIVLYLLSFILPSLVAHLPVVVNTAGVKISTCYLAGMQTNQIGEAIARSFGIFWEPGVYQIYLNIAVVFLLFFQNDIKGKQLIILAVAIVLTFSTTGYIVLALIIVVYTFFNPQEKELKKHYIGVITLIVLVSLVLVQFLGYELVIDRVFGKLTGTNSSRDASRLGSIIVNTYIFIQHPLAGVGMKNMEAVFVKYSNFLLDIPTAHNTNTTLYQFAAHGVFWGIPFLVGTIKCMLKARTNKFTKICLAASVLLLFSGENLWHSILPYLLIFYGYKNTENEKRVSIVIK